MGQAKKNAFLLIISLAMLLVGIAVFPFARNSQRQATSRFNIVTCNPECVINEQGLKIVSESDVENVTVSIAIPDCQIHKAWDPLGRGSLWLSPFQVNSMQIQLPILAGRAFGDWTTTIPSLHGSCHVQVQIRNSRKFVVTVNHQYVYGMRYNSPVFFIGNVDFHPNQTLAGYISAQGVNGPSRYQWSWELLDIFGIAVGCFLLSATIVRSLMERSMPDRNAGAKG